MKVLLVVDMQNDFVTGTLGSDAARAIVPNVVQKIRDFRKDFNYRRDSIYATMDAHIWFEDYVDYDEEEDILDSYFDVEQTMIPKHCVCNTEGAEIQTDVLKELCSGQFNIIEKHSFCAAEYMTRDQKLDFEGANEIHIVGLCTDICVISNALYLRGLNPTARIIVDASCCAGTSAENHEAALRIMKACCIKVVGESNET